MAKNQAKITITTSNLEIIMIFLMKFFGTFLIFLISLSSFAQEKFYGKNSTEATLSFEGKAILDVEGDATVTQLNNVAGRLRKVYLEDLDYQIQHLMGTFQSVSFQEEFGYPGVIGADYDISFKTNKLLEDGRHLVTYKYSSKVVFQKQAFKSSPEILIPIKLPLSASEIYDLGIVRGMNKCTDEHYNSEDDFWYFWDPDMEGCPLKNNSKDVLRIKGKLKIIQNTKLTYPEYNLLYGDNGNGNEFSIALFLGYIDDLENVRVPNRRDDGATALKEVEANLIESGFVLKIKKDAFRDDHTQVTKGINYYRVYEKEVTSAIGKSIIVKVKLLLADTESASIDGTFHKYLIPAYKNDDIIIYDGHSGLGGNLSLDILPTFSFKPNKYQIIYFNGCSSYPYFNGNYFDAKGGTKYLDIITSGLPTFTATASSNMNAFLNPFINGKTLSYQSILNAVENSNFDYGTYLTGVNGDEDNKYKPQK